jgi:hypothetical protein
VDTRTPPPTLPAEALEPADTVTPPPSPASEEPTSTDTLPADRTMVQFTQVSFDLNRSRVVGRDYTRLVVSPEDFKPIEAHPRGVVEAGRDVAQGLALEAPERVGRDSDPVRSRGSRGLLLGGKWQRQGGEGSGGEKVATLHDVVKDHDGGGAVEWLLQRRRSFTTVAIETGDLVVEWIEDGGAVHRQAVRLNVG